MLNSLLVISYPQSGRSNNLDQSSHLLTVATRDLFSELDRNVKPVAPMQFWMVCCCRTDEFNFLLYLRISLYMSNKSTVYAMWKVTKMFCYVLDYKYILLPMVGAFQHGSNSGS